MQPISPSQLSALNAQETKKRSFPTPSPLESAESSLLKKASIEKISLNPEIAAVKTEDVQIFNPASPIANFLILLTRHITSSKIISIKRHGEKFSVETEKRVIWFTLSRNQEQVLTDFDQVVKEDLTKLFVTPILCEIKGELFRFSLFSLFFDHNEYVEALMAKLKKIGLENNFFAYASAYLLQAQKTHFKNPSYECMGQVYLSNIMRLSPNQAVYCHANDMPLLESFSLKIKTTKLAQILHFPYEAFYFKEARLNFSRTDAPLTDFMEYFCRLRKEGGAIVSSDGSITRLNEKGAFEKLDPAQAALFIKNDYLQPARTQLAQMLGVSASRVKVEGTRYAQDHFILTMLIDEEIYELPLNTSQKSILCRDCPISKKPSDVLLAFTKNIRAVNKKNSSIAIDISLLSLFFEPSPFIRSIIMYLLERFSGEVPKDFLGFAAAFALAPFNQKLIPYLDPECYNSLAVFYENLKLLNSGSAVFHTPGNEKVVEIGSKKWQFVKGDTLNVVIANRYLLEAQAVRYKSTYFVTDHILSWRQFVSDINIIEESPLHGLTFEHQGRRYTVKGIVAISDIFKKIVSDLQEQLKTLMEKPGETIEDKPVDLIAAKDRIAALLRLYPLGKDFTISLKNSKGRTQLSLKTESKLYLFTLSQTQYETLFLLKPSIDAFLSPIDIQNEKNESIGVTSLFSLFYDKNAYVDTLVKKIQQLPFYYPIVIHASFYATQPFTQGGPFVNPELIPLTSNFFAHFSALTVASSDLSGIRVLDSRIKIGENTWTYPEKKITSFQNCYYYEALEAKDGKTGIETEHTRLWKRFLKRVEDFKSGPNNVSFSFNNKPHNIVGITACDPVFQEIATKETCTVTEIKSAERLSRVKALVGPIAQEIDAHTVDHESITLNAGEASVRIELSEIQLAILSGNIQKIKDINELINPIKIEFKNEEKASPVTFYTCLLALFYEKSNFNDQLIERLKPLATIPFMANAANYALWPFLSDKVDPFLRPGFFEKSALLLDNLDKINGNKNMFPWPVERLTTISIGDKKRFLAPSKVVSTLKECNLYRLEALICAQFLTADLKTDHVLLWKSFYQNIRSIEKREDVIRVAYNDQTVVFKGAAVCAQNNFKAIVSKQEVGPSETEAPQQAAVSQTSDAAIIKPAASYLQIADVIETYWFQNGVNYSRWIKLLRESKGVFSFSELPNELMKPLAGFKKEDVDTLLKFFGVGDTLFKGDLPDEIVEKSIPTLLRVKAAEFKLLKSTLSQERKIVPVQFKPCYLVKAATRFVHAIKITARFDRYGLISGFILNEQAPVEKPISIKEFNALVEEGKKKNILVLQRETIKLVEEANQEEASPKLKRSRELEDGAAQENERAQKEAKSDPILPPVPQARQLKRSQETEGRVQPKAPKETKFSDKGDISTDRQKALGKPNPEGIIPPPDLMEKIDAPALQNALTLDELFSALSANAGAQVEYVVKSGLSRLKAIFTEEPIEYEGLELISKLENTPLPAISNLVPKSKKYQWDYVLEAKRREEAGLGTILSPYMGLGKTWIYVSKVILSIYEGSNGHHLIITPKALRKTIYDDALIILNNARLNAFIHLKSIKWGNYTTSQIIKETNPAEKEFLLSLLGLFEEHEFNQIMGARGPLVNELTTTFVGSKFNELPTKLQRLYQYAKSIAPKELPQKGRFDEQGLERIFTFSSSKIKKCDDAKDLARYASSIDQQVIIASYEQMQLLASNPKSASCCSSLIFDEAQYIHNPETQIAGWAETLLVALNPKSKIAVTGTPIENGVEDLFQLVGLVAPKLKCPAILSTLSTLSKNASRFLKAKQTDLALTHLLKFHGHLQAYLNRISKHLVLVLPKEDPRVKEAWGEGARLEFHTENITLSELAKRKYEQAHELFKTRKADPVSGKKIDGLFSYYAKVSSILLDPELEVASLTPSDPNIQRRLKWIKNEAGMEDIDRLIERSALLKSITSSSKTLQAVQEKRVVLIFVANIAVGKIVRKILKKKFPEASGTESYLMHGSQTQEKKDRIIDKLKETGKSKFGVLSLDSGSTGFSIPEAFLTIITIDPYNPASVLQALGRMNRATSTGLKIALNLRFGIFSEEHIPVVQSIKTLTYKSFFNPSDTQLERLKDMAQLIRNNIYQSLLNDKRDAALAKHDIEEIDALIDSMLEGIEEDELKDFVNRLTPPLPKIVSAPLKTAIAAKGALPPLQKSFVKAATETLLPARIAPLERIKIPGNKLFKMPLPKSLSHEDKIRLALFIEQNRKALVKEINEIYQAFKNPELRSLLRDEKEMPTPDSARACQTLLRLIQDAKRAITSIHEAGIDTFKIEGQDYVLEDKTNEGAVYRIKLAKGINGLFEILI